MLHEYSYESNLKSQEQQQIKLNPSLYGDIKLLKDLDGIKILNIGMQKT